MEINLNHIRFWNFNGKSYKFEVFLSDDFSHLDNITEVSCLVLNDENNVILGKHRFGTWSPLGGTPEKAENIDTILARELLEEGNVDINVDKKVPFYYQKAFRKGEDGEWSFRGNQIRYIARLKTDYKFEKDPDGGIVEVDWFKIDQLNKKLEWGETGEMIEKYLPEYLKLI